MLFNWEPNDSLLQQDGYHLNEKGLSFLANNIRRVIHSVLNLPTVGRDRSIDRDGSDRGRGRGRGFPRGRGFNRGRGPYYRKY